MIQKHLTSSDIDKVTLITQLISKHQEQKEAFLKACTLARRTAETFLKYSNRSLQFFTQPTQSTFKGPEAKVKGNEILFNSHFFFFFNLFSLTFSSRQTEGRKKTNESQFFHQTERR